jgi:hypothetical protein
MLGRKLLIIWTESDDGSSVGMNHTRDNSAPKVCFSSDIGHFTKWVIRTPIYRVGSILIVLLFLFPCEFLLKLVLSVETGPVRSCVGIWLLSFYPRQNKRQVIDRSDGRCRGRPLVRRLTGLRGRLLVGFV